jgi:hypothetical protein
MTTPNPHYQPSAQHPAPLARDYDLPEALVAVLYKIADMLASTAVRTASHAGAVEPPALCLA